MLRSLLAGLALLCLMAAPAPAQALATNDEVYARTRAAFLADDYARLDAMAESGRAGSARTTDGNWQLAVFYGTFDFPAFVLGEEKEADLTTYDRLLARIDAWMAARPGSIAAAVVKARVLTGRGWHQRGGDYAANVPEAAMRAFSDDLMRAFAVLGASSEGGARDPAWHQALLSIYMAYGDRANFADAADRALGLHPGYHPLYGTIMRANLPQWRGSPEEMEAAARRIAAAARIVGEEDAAYARAYWSIARDNLIVEQFFKNTQADWKRMRAGFEAIEAAYPSDYNLNHFAWFACKGVDPQTALRLLDRIGTNIVPDVWDYEGHWQHCRNWASQPNPPLAGERPDQTPIYVVAAFDRAADGALAPAFEPAVHPSEEAAVAAARSLVAAHRGVTAWKIIPSIAGETVFAPEVLFTAGETLTADDMRRQAVRR